MNHLKSGDDIYDVNKYTDEELYNILDMTNPSDRELEAKLFHMIKKYQNMQTDAGNKLAWFFNAIYARFFEIIEDDHENIDESQQQLVEGNGPPQKSSSNTVTQLEYKSDYINPFLKQSINRIICIDSQYRDDKKNTMATNFNFNLSDSLQNVVALRLQSIHIPKTWYLISKSYGSNFFYLKGNSPGIEDGSHDYKISVPVGNYTATELIDKLNSSITKMKSTYSDASFGNTGFLYDKNSCRATFTLDYKKIYGETNYALYFPSWSYPLDGSNNGYYDTIPQMLGYDLSSIVINSINSAKTLSGDLSNNVITDSPVIYTDDNEQFYLSGNNNFFSVINYNGYDSSNSVTISADASYQYMIDLSSNFIYNTIQITSSLVTDASYSRYDIVNDFNGLLQSNNDLSGAYIERIVTNDSHMDGYGNSYYKFVVQLNPFTTMNAKNQKTAVVFPNDSTLWLGSDSCFQFDVSVNEVSNRKGSTTTKQSNFEIGSNVYFTAQCNASGYNVDGLNDVSITIVPGTYNLTEYINAINDSIHNANAANNYFFDANASINDKVNVTGFSLNQTTNNRLRMRFYMHKEFTTNMYSFDPTDASFAYFGFKSLVDLSSSHIFNGSLTEVPGTFTLYDCNLFKIKPNNGFDCQYAASFDISLNCAKIMDNSNNIVGLSKSIQISTSAITNATPQDVNAIFNYTIQSWTDPILGIQPLANTTFDCSIDTSKVLNSTLDLSVNVVLNSQNYNVVFTDASNSWSDYLRLETSYNMKDDLSYNYTPIYDVSYSQYDGVTTIYGNMVTLYDGSNNIFYIDPVNSGVTDGTNANRISITIDASANGTKYSLNTLKSAIQNKFDTTTSLLGSKIAIDASGYVTIRINHSKIYVTDDYRIVFYDPYSFVRCFTGASSVKNTSWDTTIGWILGFRDLTEYPLGTSYITYDKNADKDDPDIDKQYYGETGSHYTYDENTNAAVIIGDTTVSVNLYNYFMIVLDDYAQNHINDGLVTMTLPDKTIAPAALSNRGTYTYDLITGDKIFTGAISPSGNKVTANRLYAESQKILSRKPSAKIYASGPFVQDVFAIIPLNVASLANGSVFVETSSSLNKQERLYFGPVNISRMHIRLITDRGDTVDLNGSDWSCTLQCDHLYQKNSL